jgi:3-methyladenine DNA glycosylase AlkC
MEPFKNEFSAENAKRIAAALRRAYPAFPLPRFSKGLASELEALELKQRVIHIAGRIEACLPDDPQVMFPILTRSLAADEADGGGLRGFLVWPLTEIVARKGLTHHAESMRALREMTIRFTAEFAIRPFLRVAPEQTLDQLHAWCADPNEHVRRLVSEGSRPLLPWGGNLKEFLHAPFPTLRLLETLYQDESDYVRLSVSNHLNDLSKHQPELVLKTLREWKRASGDSSAFAKLSRHACRTLIKQGHSAALAFHGYCKPEQLEVHGLRLGGKRLTLGESLPYELRITNRSQSQASVLFDYAIHYRKANGTLSPKVFKGRKRILAPGETWRISGSHPLVPVTTRVHHPGLHRFEPRVNGMRTTPIDFILSC